MSETTVIEPAPLTNSPEARTPEGQIKDQSPPTPTATTEATEAKTETKTEQTALTPEKTEKTEKTLLNDLSLNGAPEKYGDFTLPENYEAGETMPKAQALFKELNLSQAGAQKLVDFYTSEIKDAKEAPQKAWEELRAKWLEEVKSDPVIGGKLDQVKTTVAKAIDGLGDPKLASEFRREMDTSGMGNNPAFIRVIHRLAEKVTEGTIVPGGGPSEVKAPNAQPRSAAHTLYPNLK